MQELNNKTTKIGRFTDLIVWKKGHAFTVEVYRITKSFPKEELFGLINQLRRAAVSFTSNIAEGFYRNSQKEKIQFYFISLGSLREIENQLLVARDVGYLPEDKYNELEMDLLRRSNLVF